MTVGLVVGLVIGLRGDGDGQTRTPHNDQPSLVPTMSQGDEARAKMEWRAELVLWNVQADDEGLTDARLVPLATPTVPVPEVAETETTIHGQEVVGLPEVHEAGNRTLGEWGADESASLPRPILPYVTQEPNSIEAIICSFDWPQGCGFWIALAVCESTLRTSILGYGGNYVGLFQVWLGHGYGSEWLQDPYNNTLAAWELSYGGWYTGPWPHCQYQ